MDALTQPLDPYRIATLQTLRTGYWHTVDEPTLDPELPEFDCLVEEQHVANFLLWHEEDEARDPAATDADIASVKRAIDRLNQRRNDLMEQLDERIIRQLGPQQDKAVLHSETPGMIIDRLSILALKIYHTGEETGRASATAAHRAKNSVRLLILEEQRHDLVASLAELIRAVLAGERRVKVYRQLKMYNDPELNPRVYGAHTGAHGGDVQEGSTREG